jgi:hypothetical protein
MSGEPVVGAVPARRRQAVPKDEVLAIFAAVGARDS